MLYPLSLEEVEGRWVAFAPALLGCFASEETRAGALAAAPIAIGDYFRWRQSKGDTLPADPAIDVVVDEIIHEWPDPANPAYMVSAFFAIDAPPLDAQTISLGCRLLDWTCAGLLAAGDVPTDVLQQPVEGEWSIAGILNHCSRAEWWYLDRLGLAPAAEKPAAWQERLALAHRQLLAVLPTLEGVGRLELKRGELWSPRKMLRRALWHEVDHTRHIYKFRAKLGM